jgi:hypothetical protein
MHASAEVAQHAGRLAHPQACRSPVCHRWCRRRARSRQTQRQHGPGLFDGEAPTYAAELPGHGFASAAAPRTRYRPPQELRAPR